MRYLLMLLGCAILAAGCNGCPSSSASTCDSSRPGQSGGCCRTSGASCDGTMVCQNGACRECGGMGQPCCGTGVTATCNSGFGCEQQSDGLFACAACGGVGQRCCRGAACGTHAVCDMSGGGDGMCVSASSVYCGGGSTPFNVGVRDSNRCAVRVLPVMANSAADAQACADTMREAGQTTVPPNVAIQHLDMCLDSATQGRNTRVIDAFSDFDARTCAFSVCENCRSVNFGACM